MQIRTNIPLIFNSKDGMFRCIWFFEVCSKFQVWLKLETLSYLQIFRFFFSVLGTFLFYFSLLVLFPSPIVCIYFTISIFSLKNLISSLM